MGAGVAKGHKSATGQVTSIQVVTSMACESCALAFTFFKRKKICNDCHRYFCSTCLPKEGILPQPRICPKCRIIGLGNFSRQDLMKLKIKDTRYFLDRHNIPTSMCQEKCLIEWKVKDMRCFLDHHNIPTNRCREKIDLIDLLIKYFSRSPENQLQTEHERMVENLAQRMRQSNAQESREVADFNRFRQQEQEMRETDARLNPAQNNRETESGRDVINSSHLRRRQEMEMREAEVRLHNELRDNETEVQGEPIPRMKLEQISSLDEVGDLTARQLKEVLANNFVDYKGCCEKAELIERVKRLWKEERNNKEKADRIHKSSSAAETHVLDEEQDLCKICMDAAIDCVLLECGHMVTCTKCGKRLAECPVCRQYVVRAVHTFRS